MRACPGFRRRADERVRRQYPIRGERGEESDRQRARGGESEAGGRFLEVVGWVYCCCVDGLRGVVEGVGFERSGVGWSEQVGR